MDLWDWDAFAIGLDGSGQHKLLKNRVMNKGWHGWSPDGKWLAVEMFNDSQKRFAIFLVNPEI